MCKRLRKQSLCTSFYYSEVVVGSWWALVAEPVHHRERYPDDHESEEGCIHPRTNNFLCGAIAVTDENHRCLYGCSPPRKEHDPEPYQHRGDDGVPVVDKLRPAVVIHLRSPYLVDILSYII